MSVLDFASTAFNVSAQPLRRALSRIISIAALLVEASPISALAASSLASGASLAPGAVLVSSNGHYTLANQADGNVVLYVDGYAIWSSGTNRPGSLTMQGDGNMVLADVSGTVWATDTAGNAGATLSVQDDGNVVVYSVGAVPLWSSGTVDVHPTPLTLPGEPVTLAAGGTHVLLLRPDGTVWAWGQNGQGSWATAPRRVATRRSSSRKPAAPFSRTSWRLRLAGAPATRSPKAAWCGRGEARRTAPLAMAPRRTDPGPLRSPI